MYVDGGGWPSAIVKTKDKLTLVYRTPDDRAHIVLHERHWGTVIVELSESPCL